MTDRVMSGGCQCGRVRYTVKVTNDEAYLCHCRMCQRATGGVSIAFKDVAVAGLAWEREPDWYASSPIARRAFCRDCGSPLGFAFPDGDNMDLTVGSFDDPSSFRPTHHHAAESMHEAWIDTHALSRTLSNENMNVVKRWMDACGKLPD